MRRYAVVVLIVLGAGTARAAEPMANQEIGARLGLELGWLGVSPGGLRISGIFLQRMTKRTWFEGEASVTFGDDQAACFRARDQSEVCDHGTTDGFAFELSGGGRYMLDRLRDGVAPYFRGGVALRVMRFEEDEVTGVSLPIVGGFGGRFSVADLTSVGGELVLTVSPGWFNRELGLEPAITLVAQFSVELALW